MKIKPIKADVFESITIPANMNIGLGVTEPPVLFIPNNKSYVELFGHRIDGVTSIDDFVNYLKQIDGIFREKESLEKQVKILMNEKLEMLNYLDTKIKECEFMRDHVDGKEYLSTQETIYRQIKGKILNIPKELEK